MMTGVIMNSPFTALSAVAILTSISLVIQTLELLVLKRSYQENGIWDWNILRKEFSDLSPKFQTFADHILSYPNFFYLIWARLFASMLVFFLPGFLIFLFLLFSSLAICIRWRGTFNGGSDYMTVVILSALTVSSAFPDSEVVAQGALYYIVIHLCFSYVISGFAKLGSSEWRRGSALLAFIDAGTFSAPESIRRLLSSSFPAFVLSWTIVLFECAFPLSLVNREICLVFLLLGFAFHLANAYFLGLNRFLFTWLAAYPALYWCAV